VDGGRPLLGYNVRNRKLVVNEAEAARMRHVFTLFAETESDAETVRRLRAEGITGKTRAGDVADAHAATRAALPLLREPKRAEGP
jgi:hypothetical protein